MIYALSNHILENGGFGFHHNVYISRRGYSIYMESLLKEFRKQKSPDCYIELLTFDDIKLDYIVVSRSSVNNSPLSTLTQVNIPYPLPLSLQFPSN